MSDNYSGSADNLNREIDVVDLARELRRIRPFAVVALALGLAVSIYLGVTGFRRTVQIRVTVEVDERSMPAISDQKSLESSLNRLLAAPGSLSIFLRSLLKTEAFQGSQKVAERNILPQSFGGLASAKTPDALPVRLTPTLSPTLFTLEGDFAPLQVSKGVDEKLVRALNDMITAANAATRQVFRSSAAVNLAEARDTLKSIVAENQNEFARIREINNRLVANQSEIEATLRSMITKLGVAPNLVAAISAGESGNAVFLSRVERSDIIPRQAEMSVVGPTLPIDTSTLNRLLGIVTALDKSSVVGQKSMDDVRTRISKLETEIDEAYDIYRYKYLLDNAQMQVFEAMRMSANPIERRLVILPTFKLASSIDATVAKGSVRERDNLNTLISRGAAITLVFLFFAMTVAFLGHKIADELYRKGRRRKKD